jgi:hypothetical protein
MARRAGKPSKSEQRARRADSLDPRTFQTFVAEAASAKQELDDANMAHAGAWKKADALGIHAQAAKLYCRLDKMEATKRADFLRAFDQYREWAGHWVAQPDMLEDDGAAETAGAAGPDDQVDEERDEGGAAETPIGEPARETEPLAAAEPIAAEPEAADWGEDRAAEASAELETAGYTFAAGKQAGHDGAEAGANPHPETSPSHPIWLRGHAQGVKEREEAAAAPATDADQDEARNEAASNGRRRRRARGGDDAGVPLH